MTGRRFTSAERVALYLAANANCATCDAELEPGWHGDHVTPYSAGGPTDVINGQALCPACNLKKGDRHMKLRPWQEDALARFLGSRDDFLAVATPGAGKTTFALIAAQNLIDRGVVSRIVVVVPTAHLRKQWAGAASRLGIQLDHDYTNGAGSLARDYDGTVVTYATVASQPLLWRKLSTQAPTLVILDEIHHAGDAEHLSWGRALQEAFAPAARRLLLSGTPFRSDKRPIPFVRYDGADCVPSYNYDYGMALQDRTVVRPVSFPVLDGDMRWSSAGVVSQALLSEAGDEQSKALLAAYDPAGSWISSVLQKANTDLTQAREEMPDAAGLVVASSQGHARRYAELLQQITGEPAVVAVSDDPEASKAIERFGKATSRWIVAVQMVAEGVDIPRLAIGVYTSRITTQMFFRQVVGRFVRMRGTEDMTTARLYIPSLDTLLDYARDIERTVDKVLAEEERQLRYQQEEFDLPREPRTFSEVMPVASSEATLHSTIFRAEEFTSDELQRARELAELAGIRSTTVEEVARLARLMGNRPAAEPEAAKASPAPRLPEMTRAEQKTQLRLRIRNLVARYVHASGVEYSQVHASLNKLCREKSINQATIATLEKRIELLTQWLVTA
ncbi:DEAD/DEAH box helicase family protein [Streptomyces asiaticus]|uniref:DEAD/DEAH box helicase family protein n=1 Tax=Streptomyces asiaticus TaxID=114695 RepID=UPI001BA80D25|nr:DEAD/DEAH box helicase family protein [Streptomyces asiaticus]